MELSHAAIEEGNVVERYLLRQLTAEEVALFEEHYLDCPECLEKLELTKRLHEGLKDVATNESQHLARATFLAWLARRGPGLRWGMALALLAVVVLPWAFLMPEVSRLSEKLDSALSPQSVTPSYVLSPERSAPGAEPSVRVTLGEAPEWVILALPLPPDLDSSAGRSETFRARLRDAEGEVLWQSGPLMADAAGRVTLGVHSSWLEAGEYVVELDVLDSEGGARAVSGFAFRVRRPA